jgi:hypothetical protein
MYTRRVVKMKKFLGLGIVLLVGLVLVGCSSLPPIASKTPTPFEGVWMKEDGTTYTFRGNQYQLLDMKNGIAADGTFRYTDTLMHIFSKTVLDLRLSNYSYGSEFIQNSLVAYKANYKGKVTIEEIESRGWSKKEGFNPELTERLINEIPIAGKYDNKIITGGDNDEHFQSYILDGNTLNIRIYEFWEGYRHLYFGSSVEGQFIRQ